MSWTKRNNVAINSRKSIRSNINHHNNNNNNNNNSYLKDFDLSACYDSFKKHWQQIQEIIHKYDAKISSEIGHDDVLTVVNHLNQILTLIQVELRSDSIINSCIDYLLEDERLEFLCAWTVDARKYNNSLRVEQLRIYEVLLSNLHSQLLNHKAFIKPLIRLLDSFNGDCLPVDIEKKLVILINQLCSSFSDQGDLINSFFPSNSSEEENNFSRFDLFSFLVQFVHRDGMIGEQARDSLLLCMSISKNNDNIAEYIISKSDICPVLAAVLSGLYSLLPRKLSVQCVDWFRFAADDVYEIKELTNFMNSLEFCNVVIQVCHPSIKEQLFDYIYQSFLVRVMGPALLQEHATNDESINSLLYLNTEEELIATTSYFELLIRSVTHPGLLQAFVKFLVQEDIDGQLVIDCLIQRLRLNSKLCVVTLSLLETLLDLNCEDIMLELILKHLIPCTHVMYSQRNHIQRVDPYCNSAKRFFDMMINIPRYNGDAQFTDYHIYLKYARNKIGACAKATDSWAYPYDGENPPQLCSMVKQEEYTKQISDVDVEHNSLPSADDGSSGYESFKMFKDSDRTIGSEENNISDDRRTNPPSLCDSENILEYCADLSRVSTTFAKMHLANATQKKSVGDAFVSTPCIGPLLVVIFEKLEDLLNCDFHVILRLTGFISRLAIYPQPLIYSFMLDHSMVFQPCIKSLFQVLGVLKQQIESRLNKANDLHAIVNEAEIFLNERLENLGSSRKKPNSESNSLPVTVNNEPFARNDNKRRSFSVAIGAMFRRNSNQEQVESVGNGCYRYMKGDQSETKHMVVCSILLNEWMKELAAISQEHTKYKTNLKSHNEVEC